MSIPVVSHGFSRRSYHIEVKKLPEVVDQAEADDTREPVNPHAPEWGPRFKKMAKANGHTLVSLSRLINKTDGALRHWTNGTRDIKLGDFYELCELAAVDPVEVLSGKRRQRGEAGHDFFWSADTIDIADRFEQITEREDRELAHAAIIKYILPKRAEGDGVEKFGKAQRPEKPGPKFVIQPKHPPKPPKASGP